MSIDLFMQATRKGWRYASPSGPLTTEGLWQLPLTHPRGGTDLEQVARLAYNHLKDLTETTFVLSRPPSADAIDANHRLELIKLVIAEKQAEVEANKKRADRAEKRRKLLAVLAAKDEQALSAASREDILAQLAALD